MEIVAIFLWDEAGSSKGEIQYSINMNIEDKNAIFIEEKIRVS